MSKDKDDKKEEEEEGEEAPVDEKEEIKKRELKELAERWFLQQVAEKKRLKEEKAAQEAEDARLERLRAREEKRLAKEAEKKLAAERKIEDDIKTKVDLELQRLREEKSRRQQPAQMPHLVKPRQLWVTYAPDAPFDERRQVRGLVRGLRERGMWGNVWLDADEDSAFPNPDHVLERCEALAGARMAVVLASPSYFASAAGQLECEVMRTRILGGFGGELTVVTLLAAECEIPPEHAAVLGPVIRLGGRGLEWVEEALDVLVEPLSGCGWWVGPEMAATIPPEDQVQVWVAARSRPLPFLDRTILSWSIEETVAWLENHGKGLARWCPAVLAAQVDGFVLPWANHAHLEAIGITCDVARGRILDEVGREVERARGEPPRDLTLLSADELEELILKLFEAADQDDNGVLSPQEFRDLMKSANLGLSSKEIRAIMAECDGNDDGMLQYKEFVPIMVELVSDLKAKREAHAKAASMEQNARLLVSDVLLRGLPQEALEGAMRALFKKADEDGNGTLSRKEFQACLKSAELGLTRKNINMLMASVDVDHDGLVSYEEFLPLCFQILVEKMKDDIITTEALQSAEGVEKMLLEGLLGRAAQGEGGASGRRLPLQEVREVVDELSREHLGLTRLQVLAILSEADAPADGSGVDVVKFAAVASTMIHSYFDLDQQRVRASAIAMLADTDASHMIMSRPREEIEQMIAEAFMAADRRGEGYLDRAETVEVLKQLGPELDLGPKDYNSLMAAVDENGDGVVDYKELVNFVLDIVTHLRREEYINGIAKAAAAREEAAAAAMARPTTPGDEDDEEWEENPAGDEVVNLPHGHGEMMAVVGTAVVAPPPAEEVGGLAMVPGGDEEDARAEYEADGAGEGGEGAEGDSPE